MSDPFDDPELQAAMAARGVKHSPGMAAAHMEKIAPLLAAEGVDLNDPDSFDADTLNAALATANERHNLELFTPVGRERKLALASLREFSDSFSAGKMEVAEDIQMSIPSDPEPDDAAVAQVIGAGLGILDEWFADPGNERGLRFVRVPRWKKAPRRLATDLVSLARKGRATRSLNTVIERNGGEIVLQAVLLAVTAAVMSIAKLEGETEQIVSSRLLARRSDIEPTSARSEPQTKSPPAAGHGRSDEEVLQEFGTWFASSGASAEVIGFSIDTLREVFHLARRHGLDIRHSAGAGPLLDVIVELRDSEPELAEEYLAAVHNYVHFRLGAATAFDNWQAAHELVSAQEATEEDPSQGTVADILHEVMSEEPEPDDDEFLAAAHRLPFVPGIESLLEWIGRSHPVTPTGNVRRKDIEFAAGLIGIDAVGVSRRPAPSEISDANTTSYVQSMDEVPMLGAWWTALEQAQLIDVGATTVRPGQSAQQWYGGTDVDIDTVRDFLDCFLINVLNKGLGFGHAVIESKVATTFIARLIGILRGADLSRMPEPSHDEHMNEFILRRLERRMSELCDLGFLDTDDQGEHFVSEPFRPTVALALLSFFE